MSAPWSGERSNVERPWLNPGSAPRRPGVSDQPGCIVFTVIPVPASSRVHSSASATWARFARE